MGLMLCTGEGEVGPGMPMFAEHPRFPGPREQHPGAPRFPAGPMEGQQAWLQQQQQQQQPRFPMEQMGPRMPGPGVEHRMPGPFPVPPHTSQAYTPGKFLPSFRIHLAGSR